MLLTDRRQNPEEVDGESNLVVEFEGLGCGQNFGEALGGSVDRTGEEVNFMNEALELLDMTKQSSHVVENCMEDEHGSANDENGIENTLDSVT